MAIQFSGNIGQAVLSAVAVQYFTVDLKRFDRLRDIILFIVIAGIIVPALVSLLVVSTFVAIEWVHNFPQVWRTRFLSNFLATLTITPLTILVWDKAGSALPAVSVRRCTEASALMLGIVAAGFLISVSSSAEPYHSWHYYIYRYRSFYGQSCASVLAVCVCPYSCSERCWY